MPSESLPNLLFITTDHQRADSLGMVQAGIEVTPNLNRLAQDAAVFTRAYNACPLCAPARTALATGKYPTRTGIAVNDFRGEHAEDHKPMHQFLSEAGFEVAHVGVHHVRVEPTLDKRLPFAKWFTDSEYRHSMQEKGISLRDRDTSRFRSTVVENQLGEMVESDYSNTVTDVWPYGLDTFKDRHFAREAVEYLQNAPCEPFALFLCLWAPHPPLEVPEPYASMFDPDAIDLPANVGQTAAGEPPGRREGMPAQLAEGLTEQEWRKVWAAHLGLTRLADDCLGDILSALDSSGQPGNTLVIFTSDHGDHLGQHRMYQKMEMYEQAINVPLVIRGPGVTPHRSDGLVSHLDLLPALLDYYRIPQPEDLDGTSFCESVTAGTPVPDRPVFSQYSGNKTVGNIRRAVITRRHKYIFDPADEPELYDLEADPLETHNLAADPANASLIRELHNLCESWGRSHGDWVFD